MENESSCTRKLSLFEILMEEILTAALMETESKHHETNQTSIPFMNSFAHQVSDATKNALSSSQSIFYEQKSVEWYTNGRNAASSFGGEKVWISWKIEETWTFWQFR